MLNPKSRKSSRKEVAFDLVCGMKVSQLSDEEKHSLSGGYHRQACTVAQLPGAPSTWISVRGAEPDIWEKTLEDPEHHMK